MSVSDEAVRAARAAFVGFPLDQAKNGTLDLFRAALEAAAPHLMAELAEPGSAMREAMSIAWEQGREDGYHHKPNPYRA